jgi:hypothetical protein
MGRPAPVCESHREKGRWGGLTRRLKNGFTGGRKKKRRWMPDRMVHGGDRTSLVFNFKGQLDSQLVTSPLLLFPVKSGGEDVASGEV